MYLNFKNFRGRTSAGGDKPWSKNGDKCRMGGIGKICAGWGDPPVPPRKKNPVSLSCDSQGILVKDTSNRVPTWVLLGILTPPQWHSKVTPSGPHIMVQCNKLQPSQRPSTEYSKVCLLHTVTPWTQLKGHWTTSASSPNFFQKSWDFHIIRSVYLCSDCMLNLTCSFNSVTKIYAFFFQ